MNYFELYDLPVQFKLDPSALKLRYIELSKRLHPDLHTLSSPENQLYMLEQSTKNNKAYGTLKDDLERTRYILQLHNLIEDEEQFNMPATFLGEVMDLNETVAEIQLDNDQTKRNKALIAIERIVESMFQDIAPFMDAFDRGEDKDENLQKIKEYYFKMKYMNRLKENIDKLAD